MSDLTIKPMEQENAGAHLRKWRRHRRLSQLELAMRAGVSGRHLSFIESGRAQPSRAMILKLATQLAIPTRGVNEILQAGGFANAYPFHDQPDKRLEVRLRTVQQILDAHNPYPAFAINRWWEAVATNRAFALFNDNVDPTLLQPPMNILRLCLHPSGLAPHILNLPEVTQFIFARLDRDIERTADPVLIALKQELFSYVEEVQSKPSQTPGLAEVLTPLRLRTPHSDVALFGMVTVFGTPNDVTLSELAIETFFPADEATEQLLATMNA